MSKDPAVLFYIDSWLVSTAEMEADCRGWYLNLLLHNYDKGSLPNDVEKLAVLCNVRFSEFSRFKHVFEQVLKQKFEQDENGRLVNVKTTEILQRRNDFKETRSNAGKVSYVMRYFAKNYEKEFNNQEVKIYVKENFDYSIDIKNEHELKQVFEHLFELYINKNRNINKDINSIKGGMGENETPPAFSPDEEEKVERSKKHKYSEFVSLTRDEYMKLVEAHSQDGADRMIQILNNYKGSKGKKYKSDYLAILNWVVDRYNEEVQRDGSQWKKTGANGGAGFANNPGASGVTGVNQGEGKPGDPFSPKDYSERF